MKKILAALPLLFVAASPALADACTQKFAAVLTSYANTRPAILTSVSQIKGAPPSETELHWLSPEHHLNKTTNPKGPWYLTFGGAMYQSDNEGKSWQKIRTLDKQPAGPSDSVKKQAAPARNAKCSEDTLNGVKHETIEAETEMSEPQKVEVHTKYWVNRADRNFVTRTETRMKAAAFEIFITQTGKLEPNLKLPKPE